MSTEINEEFLQKMGFEKVFPLPFTNPFWCHYQNEYDSKFIGVVMLMITQDKRIEITTRGVGTISIHVYSEDKLQEIINWIEINPELLK